MWTSRLQDEPHPSCGQLDIDTIFMEGLAHAVNVEMGETHGITDRSEPRSVARE
jgi:hypothetical protein